MCGLLPLFMLKVEEPDEPGEDWTTQEWNDRMLRIATFQCHNDILLGSIVSRCSPLL